MAQETISLDLSPDEKAALGRLIRDRNTPAKVVWRAEIVLATAAGLGTMAITRTTGKSKRTVWRWQERYLAEGIDGLKRNKTRPPSRKPLSHDLKLKVFAKTANERPANATHWSVRYSLMTAVVAKQHSNASLDVQLSKVNVMAR